MFSQARFFELICLKPLQSSTQADYYWNLYQKFGDRTFVPKFNWAGMPFGSTLFLYRRMYLTFLIMLIIEQMIESYITTLGFDRGMAHAYSTFLVNLMTATIFNSLYMRFVRKKSEKKENIGVHVRLFLPIMIFLCFLFGGMVFQFIGLHWHIPLINTGVNYIFAMGLVLMVVLYIHYFNDWRSLKKF